MKIFHYDYTDFYLLGQEEVSDEKSIPNAATDVPPPEFSQWPPGKVPVYEEKNKRWVFKNNNFWKVYTEEKCFYTGRESDGPTYVIGGQGILPHSAQLMHLVNNLPRINIPRIGYLPSFVSTVRRIEYIDSCIEQLELYFAEFHSGGSNMIVRSPTSNYYMLVEILIGAIRRFLDDLSMVLYLDVFKEYDPWKMRIVVDGFSCLFDEEKITGRIKKRFSKLSISSGGIGLKIKKLRSIILGENHQFLNTIQDMNNCFKHSVTASAGQGQFGRDYPTAFVVGIPEIGGSLDKLTYYNSNLRQIIMGFKDYIRDSSARHLEAEKKSNSLDFVYICGGHKTYVYKWVLNGPLVKNRLPPEECVLTGTQR